MVTETRQLVIQFAKVPVPGKVKTRLAKAIGDVGALAAHCELIQFGVSSWQSGDWAYALWWDQPPNALGQGLVEGLVEPAALGIQSPGTLGDRMTHALVTGLQQYEQVVIVGSDCPFVTVDYLGEAFSALDACPVVLGPAEDGGFVLIGMNRQALPKVRENWLASVAWGTGDVLVQTLGCIRRAGLRVRQLATGWDVDEETDWLRFKEGEMVP